MAALAAIAPRVDSTRIATCWAHLTATIYSDEGDRRLFLFERARRIHSHTYQTFATSSRPRAHGCAHGSWLQIRLKARSASGETHRRIIDVQC